MASILVKYSRCESELVYRDAKAVGEFIFIPKGSNMQISERGQVTIPKEYRARFGLLPHTEVEFVPRNNELVLVRKQATQSKAIRALRGR